LICANEGGKRKVFLTGGQAFSKGQPSAEASFAGSLVALWTVAVSVEADQRIPTMGLDVLGDGNFDDVVYMDLLAMVAVAVFSLPSATMSVNWGEKVCKRFVWREKEATKCQRS
jgi:hypothetical protein